MSRKDRFNLSELSSVPEGVDVEAFGILRFYEEMTGNRQSNNRRRLIYLFDDKCTQDVICSLWDDTAEYFTDKANIGDIVYLGDARICNRIKKDMCGLTASGTSCVEINPPHQVAKELARWRDRCFLEPADLTQIINDYLTVDNSVNNRERGDEMNIVHGETRRVKKQPSMLTGGRLVAYQVDGLVWLVSLFSKNLNGILADEIGLSKPIQIAAFIAHLNELKNCFISRELIQSVSSRIVRNLLISVERLYFTSKMRQPFLVPSALKIDRFSLHALVHN